MSVSVRIKLVRKTATLPTYQTEGAAALDLTAAIDESITLKPGERRIVPSGIAIELPAGYEAQVRARSGHGAKYGIGLVNGVGTVDSDYRGEIGILLINWGTEDFVIEPGMRIAQMVIAKYEQVKLVQIDALSETKRGSGGFGSTN